MSFRITSNMMRNTYQYNLMNSTNNLNNSMEKVQTQRNFNSYAEDPASATLAFRLRREYFQTSSQIANSKDVYSKFNTGWNNIQGMLKDLINPMDKVSIIRGDSDTSGESRTALAQILRESSESMIQGFNQQLGGHFIFAGNDGLNAPFTWKDGNLYYRGIDVNSGGMKPPTAPEPTWIEDVRTAAEAAGTWSNAAEDWYNYYTHQTDKLPPSAEPSWLTDYANLDGQITDEEQAWIDYYRHETTEPPTAEKPKWANSAPDKYGIPEDMPQFSDDEMQTKWIAYYTDQANYAKLKEMSEEEMYIDLGMGAAEKGANNPLRGTYFNSALSGLNFLDYGIDEDGDPKNFAVLLNELADVFDNWNENGQKYVPDEYLELTGEELKQLMEDKPEVAEEINAYNDAAREKAFRLMDKLKEAQETLTAANVELDARSSFLQTNLSQLQTQATDLNTQILDVEQVDMAAAITEMSWDQYCYSAALKIGNQLLSQSLIDYMN